MGSPRFIFWREIEIMAKEDRGMAVLEGQVAMLPSLEPKPAEPPRDKAAICRPTERAPAGWTRYRIRGEQPSGNTPVRYVLAKTQADAVAEYRRQVNAGQRIRGTDGKDGDYEVRLVVKLLAD